MNIGGKGTTAKIFSTKELMETLKLLVLFMRIAIGFYFELRLIFGRFCTILNIEDKRMIQIDPETKMPVNKSEIKVEKFSSKILIASTQNIIEANPEDSQVSFL